MKRFVSRAGWGMAILGLAFWTGCDDIIEDDITDEVVITIAPTNGQEIEGNSVQFRWNHVDGADDYRIQVNNTETNRIILDSLVIGPVFDFTIDPGSYQWRVRGENFAYVTAYSFDSDFTVLISDDLSNQTVELEEPNNELFINSADIEFSWKAITSATFYKIKISEVDGTNETLVFDNNGENVVGTSITIQDSDLPNDRRYKWEILAGNDTSESNFFPRIFTLDRQKPPIPTLTEPTSGETAAVDTEITFKWDFTDTGDVMSTIDSTIQIATDADFNDVIHANPSPILENEYMFTFTEAGTYFWRVKLEDKAGNDEDFSEANQIVIN